MEKQKNITRFVESINCLSGTCGGKFGWDLLTGMLTIVDTGMEKAIVEAKNKLHLKNNLTGFCVGAGGLFSLLPEIPFDSFFLVDMNSAVVNFNRFLGQILASELSNPLQSLLARLSSPGQDDETIVNEIKDEKMQLRIKTLLDNDISRLGNLHWSRNERRQLVKAGLQQVAIGYLHADISTDKFSQRLKEKFQRQGREIDFLNLTNVHEYNWQKGQMSFLLNWPIAINAVIMFSSHKYCGLNHYPQSEVVTTLKNYLQRVEEDFHIAVP